MTVSTSTAATTLGGNGAQTTFAFTFIWTSANTIQVLYTDPSGNQTQLSPSQYTLALNAAAPGALWGIGGSVTYPLSGSPIPNGSLITIQRVLPFQQQVSIQNQGDFNAQVIEQMGDLLCMLVQQVVGTLGLAFTANPADTTPPLPAPPAAARANMNAIFDAMGNLTAGSAITNTTVSTALIPFVTAATLAAARTVLGLGAAAVEGLSSTSTFAVLDDGAGNLTTPQIAANTIVGNNTGSPAYATPLTVAQVNAMLGNTFQLFFAVGGGNLSNDGSSPNTTIDISACVAMSDDNTTLMVKSTTFKKTTSAWVAGSGNGGWLDGGSMGASKWGHVFMIENTSSSAIDYGLSASLSPTLPSGYTKKRRIGTIRTNASGNILAFTQMGNGSIRSYIWSTGVVDVNAANPTTASRTLTTLASIPNSIKVDAILDIEYNALVASGQKLYVTSPDENDNTNAATVASFGTNDPNGAGRVVVRTNTSQQVGVRSTSASGTFTVNTIGWNDYI